MALTDAAIRNAKPREKPYKVADSKGLYLQINPAGSKLWRLKYRINGVNRRSIGTPYRRAKGTPLLSWWVVDAGRGFRAAGGVGRA